MKILWFRVSERISGHSGSRSVTISWCINLTHTRTHAHTHTLYTHARTHTHTHNRLTALCPGLPRWAGTRKVKPIWILLEQETVSGSGISWAICKSAPCSRQITTSAPHHSVFTGQMPFLPPNQQRQSTEGNETNHRPVTLTFNLWSCPIHKQKIKVQGQAVEELEWNQMDGHNRLFCLSHLLSQ